MERLKQRLETFAPALSTLEQALSTSSLDGANGVIREIIRDPGFHFISSGLLAGNSDNG